MERMLRRFLRWSRIKPLARFILKRHGRTIIHELLERAEIALPQHSRFDWLHVPIKFLKEADEQDVRALAEFCRQLGTAKAFEAAYILDRIAEVLA